MSVQLGERQSMTIQGLDLSTRVQGPNRKHGISSTGLRHPEIEVGPRVEGTHHVARDPGANQAKGDDRQLVELRAGVLGKRPRPALQQSTCKNDRYPHRDHHLRCYPARGRSAIWAQRFEEHGSGLANAQVPRVLGPDRQGFELVSGTEQTRSDHRTSMIVELRGPEEKPRQTTL